MSNHGKSGFILEMKIVFKHSTPQQVSNLHVAIMKTVCVHVHVYLCLLPVTSWSCVSRLTLVAHQLPFFTQVAGGAETIVVAIKMLFLEVLINLEALSQYGKRQKEEEERTEVS